MDNNNAFETHGNMKYKPMCSGWKVFPGGKKCKGCPDCTTQNKMATKKKATAKKKTTAKVGVKADGTLKKGYRYITGGRVVKAKGK